MEKGYPDTLSIGMVAAQLGVSTATLRKWEERYGVPQPLRLPSGTRRYPKTQLRHLQRAVRLIDGGVPTARALTLAAEDTASNPFGSPEAVDVFIDGAYADLRRGDLLSCECHLRQAPPNETVVAFVDGVLAPLLRRVGDGWLSGELEVFHEHAVTEVVSSLLKDVPITTAQRQDAPLVLLTTPPDERHALGTAMVAAALSANGARCVNLGPELTCDQVLLAAERFGASIIGIGLSLAVRPRLIEQYLGRLRSQLPGDVELWLGGEGASRLQSLPDGVRYFSSAGDAVLHYQVMTAAEQANMTGPAQ